jgi:hypothetical protein
MVLLDTVKDEVDTIEEECFSLQGPLEIGLQSE